MAEETGMGEEGQDWGRSGGVGEVASGMLPRRQPTRRHSRRAGHRLSNRGVGKAATAGKSPRGV